MQEKLAAGITGSIALIPVLLELKKALKGLQVVPIAVEGMNVAARGGDFSPYLVAMILLFVSIMIPLGLIRAIADV